MSWNIAGHDKAVATLRAAIAANKVGHAFMFAGPSGIGKAHLAKLFAQALLCEETVEGEPCGACKGCRLVAAESHPDLHWLAPTGSSIRIDQVRALQGELALRPFAGRYKVCVIDDADRLTEQAQNSMLKSLEEPPGSGVLILIAHKPSAILPTIHSRCQVLRMRPVRVTELSSLLSQRKGFTPEEAALLAALSEGKPGQAMRLDKEALLEQRSKVVAWIHSLGESGWQAALRIAAELEKVEELDPWLDMCAIWLRDIWHTWQSTELPTVNSDMNEALQDEAARWKNGASEALLAIAEARKNLQRNANKRLTIDVMLMKMQRGLFYDSCNRRPLQAGG